MLITINWFIFKKIYVEEKKKTMTIAFSTTIVLSWYDGDKLTVLLDSKNNIEKFLNRNLISDS